MVIVILAWTLGTHSSTTDNQTTTTTNDNRHTTNNNQQQTTNNKQQTTNNQQPTTNNKVETVYTHSTHVCAVCRWIDLHGTDETGHNWRRSLFVRDARLQYRVSRLAKAILAYAVFSLRSTGSKQLRRGDRAYARRTVDLCNLTGRVSCP